MFATDWGRRLTWGRQDRVEDWRSVMPQLQVRDVMTAEVITARDDASCADVAAMLASHQISAVPIVDRFDAVVGVVSWTDLRAGIEMGEPAGVLSGWWRRKV